jgi:hypothetical protein
MRKSDFVLRMTAVFLVAFIATVAIVDALGF